MSEINRPLEYNDSFPVGWIPQPKVITAEEIRAMPPEKQKRMAEVFKRYKETEAVNPLWHVYLRSQAHHAYASCRALIGICLAGNRFGKTSTAVILALINCVPMEWVPPHLMQYRRYLDDEPFVCRITGTSLKDHALDIVVPLLKRWTPRATLKGGAWDKAWSAANYTLTFKHGSSIEFRSYDQPAENHAGAARHAIFLDEPPPRDIFFESLARVTEFDGGFVRVGATMAKGVPPWFRKELYEKSKTSPDIDVFFGSIHDNDTISADNKEKVLSIYSERERKIREYGRLLSLEGAIYDAFDFTKHVVDDITPAALHDYRGSIYIGIDPGKRNPAAVFAAANNLSEEILFFDEVTPRMNTMSVEIFVGLIRERMEFWGLEDHDVHFVIDPAVLQGQQATGETLLTEFERHSLYPELGNNSHDVGIPRFNDLLHADKVYFNEQRCLILIDQMESWSWHETLEDAKGKPKPQEGGDDACFIAGTLIETERGPVPVEEVTTADRVLTRHGYFPVLVKHARKTKVLKLTTANGRSITGTPEHPAWVEGVGFVALDSVRYGDRIAVCPSLKRSSTTESRTTATQSQTGRATASISRLIIRTGRRVRRIFTGKSGSTRTARSRMAAISTMLTATRSITTSETWSASRLLNMLRGIGRQSDLLRQPRERSGFVRLPQHGTPHRRDLLGTVNMVSESPPSESHGTTSASSAGPRINLKTPPPLHAFARTDANPVGAESKGLTTLTSSASSVDLPFGRISMPGLRLAGERVVDSCEAGEAKVYNLTVLGPPEYFANGVLVHNCDAARYVIMALPWSEMAAKKDPAPAKGTLDEFLQNIPKPLSRARKQAAWAL